MALPNVIVEVQVEEADENSEQHTSIWTRLKNFYTRNFLQIGTIFSVFIGIFLPQPAVYLGQKIPVTKTCIILLYFTVGLRLRLAEAKSAVKLYKEIVVALFLVLFVGPGFASNVITQVPYFGYAIVDEKYSKNSTNITITEIPILGPEEFRIALQIYLMCPSAPITSLMLVTAANGHRGLNILVSILCLIISVFTIPPMLKWFVPTLNHLHINVVEVLVNILLNALLPLAIGRCLRSVTPVKTVITKWSNTLKYIGISFIFPIFLFNVSESSASGNLGKVSVVNILCAAALGASLTTFNALSSYGVLSILPWFSKKTTVTLSVLSCIRVIGLAVTIVNTLPNCIGDKGLVVLLILFVYLATLLIANGFVSLVKVKEEHTSELDKALTETMEKDKRQDKDPKARHKLQH